MEEKAKIDQWDSDDSLARFRQKFHFPKDASGNEVVYLTGNSLGLQPEGVEQYLNEELKDWRNYGVEGHVEARRPWVDYHKIFRTSLARVVGAHPEEVVAMNGLTANLHFLMVSFFRPKGRRVKLLCEAKAFPSDIYALKSQLRFHGLDESNLILLENKEGEDYLKTEDILEVIEEHGEEIAFSLLGGVNYYTGQFFDIPKITDALHKKGAIVGWDLAHAAGNTPLQLHDWGVDCAAWCSYKYLNSGPGNVSGIYIHKKYHGLKDIPRFEGWWGHDDESRFAMPTEFVPMPSAEAWQLSNAPVLGMAAHRASLDIFDETSMDELRGKSLRLTAYLEEILDEIGERYQTAWRILTPRNPEERGCQLSLYIPSKGRELFEHLKANGVTADWRNPDVIRMAPAPLYNSFNDLYRLKNLMIDFYENA